MGNLIDSLVALIAFAQAVLGEHVLLAIGLVIFIEETGVPFLFPGDVSMVLAGVEVARGHATLASVLIVEQVATMLGAGVLYTLGRRFGRPVVEKYGRYIGVGPDQLQRGEEQLLRHGTRSIIVGRLVPGLRIVTVVACGIAGVPPRTFFPALAVGGFLYLCGFTLLGYYLGTPALHLLARLALPASALWSVGGLAVVVLGARTIRRVAMTVVGVRGSAGEATLDGLLAGLAGLFAANALIGLGASVLRLLGNEANFGLLRAEGVRYLVLGWPAFLVMAAAVVVGYRLLRLDRFAMPVRLLLTGAAPLLVTWGVLDLMSSATPRGGSLLAALVFSAPAVRWAVFAIVLEIAHGGATRATRAALRGQRED